MEAFPVADMVHSENRKSLSPLENTQRASKLAKGIPMKRIFPCPSHSPGQSKSPLSKVRVLQVSSFLSPGRSQSIPEMSNSPYRRIVLSKTPPACVNSLAFGDPSLSPDRIQPKGAGRDLVDSFPLLGESSPIFSFPDLAPHRRSINHVKRLARSKQTPLVGSFEAHQYTGIVYRLGMTIHPHRHGSVSPVLQRVLSASRSGGAAELSDELQQQGSPEHAIRFRQPPPSLRQKEKARPIGGPGKALSFRTLVDSACDKSDPVHSFGTNHRQLRPRPIKSAATMLGTGSNQASTSANVQRARPPLSDANFDMPPPEDPLSFQLSFKSTERPQNTLPVIDHVQPLETLVSPGVDLAPLVEQLLYDPYLSDMSDEDWVEDGKSDASEGSENPGSEEDIDSDWEDYACEMREEELPRLGIYSDTDLEFQQDPFQWQMADENWNQAENTFSHNTNFLGGPSVARPKFEGAQTPISIFEQILDSSLIRLVVVETNRYAQKNDTTSAWKEVTRPELRAWLGVAMYMGIMRMPARRHHWRRDEPLFANRLIPSIMTRDRFEAILRNLHVVDNEKLNLDRTDPAFDKICKIRPFLDRISYRSRKFKDVDEHVTVDEMMILGGGRLCPIMQHNPNKPVKHGIKILATCSSSTKFVYNFNVYCGAQNNVAKSVLDQTLEMVQFVPLHRNHKLTTDNWFTSVTLFLTLLKSGILCLGTARTNRVGWPTSLTQKSNLAKRGDLIWSMHRSQSIAAAVWMDHTQVALLSTWVQPEDPECRVRRWDKRQKTHVFINTSPMLVAYQKWMRGVDVQDQLREVYSLRQRTRKWWHRLFWFAIDTAITNSWILFALHQGAEGLPCGDHLSFMLRLAHSLCSGYVTSKSAARSLGVHIPPFTERGAIHFSMPTKRRPNCVECHRRTRMCCPRCKWIGLCLGRCFSLHHERKTNCCDRKS